MEAERKTRQGRLLANSILRVEWTSLIRLRHVHSSHPWRSPFTRLCRAIRQSRRPASRKREKGTSENARAIPWIVGDRTSEIDRPMRTHAPTRALVFDETTSCRHVDTGQKRNMRDGIAARCGSTRSHVEPVGKNRIVRHQAHDRALAHVVGVAAVDEHGLAVRRDRVDDEIAEIVAVVDTVQREEF